ncbi:cytochrome P450 [Jatrophihabitans sp.]|uniref:cytochrome P450 n=1 Tax=Jatrophihabitans sp. TaxID=1932789 RepID=UPI0030C6D9F0|nr:hypothetical protein [Jatrophihabitans sp.]
MNNDAFPLLSSTADSEPFEYFDRLREFEPVHWDSGLKAWVVTDYSLARQVMREDKKAFRHPFADMMTPAMVAAQGGPRGRNFQHGETHGRMHRWILSQFHPRLVPTWRKELIRPIADELIGRFAADGSADLVHALADPLPIRVIAAMLELPWRDDDWIARCRELMDAKDAYLQKQGQDEDPALAAKTITAMEELNDLVRPFVNDRRDGTGADFISQCWQAGPSMLPDWGEEDTLGMVTGMFFAGTDTTAHTIASGFHLLLHDEALLAQVREGGDTAIEAFTEEALRLHGAVQFRLRRANEEIEIGGVTIEKDATVLNLHAAANRDPAAWESPHEVKLDRSGPTRPRDHLAFSMGPRLCAGAALARAEIDETVAAVLDWFPDLKRDPAHDADERYLGFALRSWSPAYATFTPVTR